MDGQRPVLVSSVQRPSPLAPVAPARRRPQLSMTFRSKTMLPATRVSATSGMIGVRPTGPRPTSRTGRPVLRTTERRPATLSRSRRPGASGRRSPPAYRRSLLALLVDALEPFDLFLLADVLSKRPSNLAGQRPVCLNCELLEPACERVRHGCADHAPPLSVQIASHVYRLYSYARAVLPGVASRCGLEADRRRDRRGNDARRRPPLPHPRRG